MTTKKKAVSIDALEKKLQQAREKVKAAQDELRGAVVAKRARERTAERRADSRRKLLVGVAVLEAVAAGELPKATLDAWCYRFIKRKTERDFLGLPALPVQEKAEGGAA